MGVYGIGIDRMARFHGMRSDLVPGGEEMGILMVADTSRDITTLRRRVNGGGIEFLKWKYQEGNE